MSIFQERENLVQRDVLLRREVHGGQCRLQKCPSLPKIDQFVIVPVVVKELLVLSLRFSRVMLHGRRELVEHVVRILVAQVEHHVSRQEDLLD